MSPSVPLLHRARRGLLPAGQWCVALALFSVPINKVATSGFIGLALIASLLGAGLRPRWRQALRDPVALGMLAWAGLMLLSALHAWAGGDAGKALRSSDIWTFVMPLVIASLLQTPRARWRALAAFAVGIGLVMLVSWLMAAGLVPQRPVAELLPSMRNTVFKEYTQQGLATLMLFSLLMAVLPTLPRRGWQVAAGVIAALALINVSFLLGSRTTYLTLVPLALYWLWVGFRGRLSNLKMLLVTGVLGLVLGATVLQSPSAETRLNSLGDEISGYVHEGQATSTGIRLWLWQHTLEMIAEAPVIGHGLGQWKPLYEARMQQVPGSEPYITGHPHQEMLLVLAEEGAVGLLVMLALLVALLRLAVRLPPAERHFVTSVVLIYFTAGLANGLIADFTHRNTFVLLLSCIPSVALLAAPRTAGGDSATA